MKKAGIDGKEGDLGFRLNLAELNNFANAKADGLTSMPVYQSDSRSNFKCRNYGTLLLLKKQVT